MISKIFLYLCVVIGYGIPIGFYIRIRFYPPVVILFAVGMFWVIPKIRKQGWLQGLALVLGVFGNAAAFWFNLPSPLVFLSTVLMLGVIELTRFIGYISLASEEDDTSMIERRHLLITLVFLGVIYLISFGVIQFSFETKFYQALIMVIVVFVGIIQLLRSLISTSLR